MAGTSQSISRMALFPSTQGKDEAPPSSPLQGFCALGGQRVSAKPCRHLLLGPPHSWPLLRLFVILLLTAIQAEELISGQMLDLAQVTGKKLLVRD